MNDKGILQVLFNHRFSQAVNDAGGNNLLGLDGSANVGIGLGYVPFRNVSIEAYRASTNGDYELAARATLLRPTGNLPLAVGVRAGVDWMTKAALETKSGGFGQLLVAATFGKRVTIGAAPTYVSNTPLFKKVWNVPVIAEVKLAKSVYATAEYVPRNKDLTGSVGQWSFALEKTYFHHRFSVAIGNTGGLAVDQIMGADYAGGVKESNIRLGFNIVRQFEVSTD